MNITGSTAIEIAASVRRLVDAGTLAPGASLPPVRDLAQRLEVNRNTVGSAYRKLVHAGVAVTGRRAGTVIAGRNGKVDQEGFTPDTTLRDIGSGNPALSFLPAPVSLRVPQSRILYGESTVDPILAEWAGAWIAADHPRPMRLTVTGGAVDAVERLLAQALTQGDGVALEDPCFLASINTVRLGGYRPIPVTVDAQGMTVDSLRSALEAGARAVVCTPRAHNPTGVSLSTTRARALRSVLADHPHVLVIEDDHYSLLSMSKYHSLIAPTRTRWALVRTVSKFLGPDLRVAVVASDDHTAEQLATRIGPGRTWTSHVLQRAAVAMLTDPATLELISRAREHYSERNHHFARLLQTRDLKIVIGDGLNVWLPVTSDVRTVSEQLLKRGWIARTGDSFSLTRAAHGGHLRLTVHELDDAQAAALADDLAAALSPS
ncbi:aminotransferase class I/II-fold pyridoxal phosphate-dependent enzyme [Mycobacterium sp. 21AC1]|uniref:aminotransferase class I/II-fold pyridoxal phosphate-dependent enzyme n=1 Tax=[Mycobacterium] appelbergii TaxID=2939269 RepID=UPI0029390893|nr:aminotransferase class I/II-fold pyridoxal phosphate-dependent enzyme [Mycobacterium sp. 21AC1]MDV3126734.1 aminotransferase class I/II-fold pyridoxal phosphate-dependent enzyme [Mycobacterium sp. 21AC1]